MTTPELIGVLTRTGFTNIALLGRCDHVAAVAGETFVFDGRRASGGNWMCRIKDVFTDECVECVLADEDEAAFAINGLLLYTAHTITSRIA